MSANITWSASTAEPRVPTWPPKWGYDERVVPEGDLVVRGEVAVAAVMVDSAIALNSTLVDAVWARACS